MTYKHEITERRSPAAILILCTCGWSRAVFRRQNALARASKVRAARAEHEREIEAEIEKGALQIIRPKAKR